MATTKMRKNRASKYIPPPIPGDVESALIELGVDEYKADSEEIIARCPAHFERTGKPDRRASWSVNTESGKHWCFSCGFGGSFCSLVRFFHKELTVCEAEEWVRTRGSFERTKRLVREWENPTKVDTSKVINEASLALYTPPPPEALESRGLCRESAEHYGVLWEPSTDSWIIPIRDPETNQLWGWQEKSKRFFKNQPYGVKKSNTLFGLPPKNLGHTLMLVESPLDVLRCNGVGINTMMISAVASYGSAFSKTQMELICDHTDTLIVAMDNDRAGDLACEQIRLNYTKRLKLFYYNYGTSPAKDVGEQSKEEIFWGIQNAYSGMVARF